MSQAALCPALEDSTASEAAVPPARRWEVPAFAAFLALVMALQIAISSPAILFQRYLWQDEQFTHFVVSDPSIAHSIWAVKGGADSNPPTFHLLLRAFRAVVPGSTQVVYRLFVLLIAWAGLIATYIILRRSFAILPSAVAILALWAHPLLIREAFDARFYIPLFSASALFCMLFWRRRTGPLNTLLVMLAAMLLCALHYFGVISLGAIALGELILGTGTLKQRIMRTLPAAVGALIALAAIFPFLLGQRADLSVATWVPSMRLESLRETADTLFAPLSLATIVLAWALTQWLTRRTDPARPASHTAAPQPLWPMTGLMSLLLVPVVLTIFSILIQPTLIGKYLITALLALAPAMAMLAARIPVRGLLALAAALIVVGAMEVHHYAWDREQPWQSQQQRFLADCQASVANGLPIVSMSRREAYMLYYAAPQTHGHVFIVDIRPLVRNQQQDELVRHLIFETDFAVKYQKVYGVPPVEDLDFIRRLGRFRLVGWEPWIEMFKQHVPLKSLGNDVYELAT
jgi:hypothetical protein